MNLSIFLNMQTKTPYYYLIMSQKDFLQSQVMEEILREKAAYYNSRKKYADFWILISPKFLKINDLSSKIRQTKFYNQKINKIKTSNISDDNLEFYTALVSLDKEFMDWVKLRLGYFENIDEVSNQNVNLNYISDGVYGKFESSQLSCSILEYDKNFLHPDLLVDKFKKSLEKYLYTN